MKDNSFVKVPPVLWSFFIEHKGVCYASCMESNGLFEIKDNGIADCIGLFGEEKAFGINLFSTCVAYDDTLVFVPEAAEHIYVYDINRKSMQAVAIEKEVSHTGYNPKCKFVGAKQNEKEVFLIPGTYPAIICLNKQTKEIQYLTDWVPQESFCFGKCCVEYDANIYSVSKNSGMILKLNYYRGSAEIVCFESKSTGGTGLFVTDNTAYIAMEGVAPIVLKVNLNTGKIIKTIEVDVKNNCAPEPAFSYVYSHNGENYICPCGSDALISIDFKNDEISHEKIDGLIKPNHTLEFICDGAQQVVFWRKNGTLWGSDRCIVVLNKKTQEIRELYVTIKNWNEYKEMLLRLKNGIDEIVEREIITLRDFLSYIDYVSYEPQEEPCGKKIYNVLRGE